MRVLASVAAMVALTSCSGGGDAGGLAGPPDDEASCALIARLAGSADDLLATGAADPEAFTAALDAAVADYTTTLDALADVVPDDLVDDVEELRGLVEQHRFQDAIEVRAALDDYARRTC